MLRAWLQARLKILYLKRISWRHLETLLEFESSNRSRKLYHSSTDSATSSWNRVHQFRRSVFMFHENLGQEERSFDLP